MKALSSCDLRWLNGQGSMELAHSTETCGGAGKAVAEAIRVQFEYEAEVKAGTSQHVHPRFLSAAMRCWEVVRLPPSYHSNVLLSPASQGQGGCSSKPSAWKCKNLLFTAPLYVTTEGKKGS